MLSLLVKLRAKLSFPLILTIQKKQNHKLNKLFQKIYFRKCVGRNTTKSLVRPLGIEPSSSALQAAAMTTSAKDALVARDRIELP